jgi:hypothetical protein
MLAWAPDPKRLRGISRCRRFCHSDSTFIRALFIPGLFETLYGCPHPQYIPTIPSYPLLVAAVKWLLIQNDNGPIYARVWLFDSTLNLIYGFLDELEWVLSSTYSNLIGIMLDTTQLEIKWRDSETPSRRNG